MCNHFQVFRKHTIELKKVSVLETMQVLGSKLACVCLMQKASADLPDAHTCLGLCLALPPYTKDLGTPNQLFAFTAKNQAQIQSI